MNEAYELIKYEVIPTLKVIAGYFVGLISPYIVAKFEDRLYKTECVASLVSVQKSTNDINQKIWELVVVVRNKGRKSEIFESALLIECNESKQKNDLNFAIETSISIQTPKIPNDVPTGLTVHRLCFQRMWDNGDEIYEKLLLRLSSGFEISIPIKNNSINAALFSGSDTQMIFARMKADENVQWF